MKRYITKYTEDGKLYAEAWDQINIFGKAYTFHRRRIEIPVKKSPMEEVEEMNGLGIIRCKDALTTRQSEPIEHAPVKHGRWIDVNGDGSLWQCSLCGEQSCCKGNYCMDCGAKMDEEG